MGFLFSFSVMQDAEELGVIFIGTESNGYSVKACVPKNARGNKWKFGVTVETPERQFVFMCEQDREQKEWLDVLTKVLSRPMSPQDYRGELLWKLHQRVCSMQIQFRAFMLSGWG